MADMQVSVTLPAPELITLAAMNGKLCRMFAEPDAAVTLAVLKEAVASLEAQIAQQTPTPTSQAAPESQGETEDAPTAETDGGA